MHRHHENPRTDLGTLVRDLAHDAYSALYQPRRGNRNVLRDLLGRVDSLLHELRDRSSSELYRWLLSLRRVLARSERKAARVEFSLDDEGSGIHDLAPRFPVG